LSVRRQCELLGLNRSSLYYQPTPESAENLRLMRLLDQEYTAHPFLGSRRLRAWLIEQGEEVNRKRVQRLLRLMGLQAIYPKPKLSLAGRGHRIYPYLLRDVLIERVDQVWSTDITYIPMATGFMYLAAIIDWYSRYVVAWRLSNTLDGSFCLDMLDEALSLGRPEVFNTDQGVQFTAEAFTGRFRWRGGEHGRQGSLPG
jgi:putative transposase